MPTEHPVLAAHWTELLLLNFRVPTALVARLAPIGTEPDLFQGESYASIVGFRYVRGRDGQTREYRVLHEPWRIASASNVIWNCELASTYEAPWTEHLAQVPVSALVADGSSVQLYRGRRI